MAARKRAQRSPGAISAPVVPSEDAIPTSSAPPSSGAHLPPHRIFEIAVKAHRHPNTIKAYLRGKNVKPTVRADIEAAMTDLGIERPERAAS